jgi:branched-subunit amino acid transport protein
MSGFGVYGAIIVAGFAVTYVWRFLAVLAIGRLDAESDLLLWVRAVATALVAALVLRLVTAPAGLLAEASMSAMLVALAVGVAAFALVGRRVEVATAVAIGCFFLADIILN